MKRYYKVIKSERCLWVMGYDRTLAINRPTINRGKKKAQMSTTFRNGHRLFAYVRARR